jgi:RHS repeat-associated protein
MTRLGPPLADLGGGGEGAIHRARRAEIGLLLEPCGLDFGRRVIDESLAVQHASRTVRLSGAAHADGWQLVADGLPRAVASAAYDAANQMTQWGSQSQSFDRNGNLASDGLTSYLWNVRNQLTVMSGGGAASFEYDAFARRRSRTVSGTVTDFMYDGMNPVQELSGGVPTANILSGDAADETFTRTDANGMSVFLTDVVGSTLALLDSTGAALTQYTFDPFGATTTSGMQSTNASQFTGRENDDTGLYYYRARYYDPRLGSFVSEDPIDPMGFVYAADQPTNLIDPFGLMEVRNLIDEQVVDQSRIPAYAVAQTNVGGRVYMLLRV